MEIYVNCIHLKRERCAAVPGTLFFGLPKCCYDSDDRVSGCNLQVEHPRPAPPVKPLVRQAT
jgi:hypothetical protein